MTGSAKGVTAAKVRSRKYILNKATVDSVKVSYQSSAKSIFKLLSKNWNPSPIRRFSHGIRLLSQPSKRILYTSAKLTDSNSTWIVYCGATTVASPTNIEGVEAPDDVTLTISTSAMTLLFASIPSFVADIKLIILTSVFQSNGVTRA